MITAIALGLTFASALWALLIGIPLALPAAAAIGGALVASRTGLAGPTLLILLAAAAEAFARHFDRRLDETGLRTSVALFGGTTALGLAVGPDLGAALAALAMGEGGRTTLRRAGGALRPFIYSRLIRGGTAVGIALWLFAHA